MWRRTYYKSTKNNLEDNLNYAKKDMGKDFHLMKMKRLSAY